MSKWTSEDQAYADEVRREVDEFIAMTKDRKFVETNKKGEAVFESYTPEENEHRRNAMIATALKQKGLL